MAEMVKLNIATLITLGALIASIVGTYYQGQSQAKSYADELFVKLDTKVEAIDNSIDSLKIDVAVMKPKHMDWKQRFK